MSTSSLVTIETLPASGEAPQALSSDTYAYLLHAKLAGLPTTADYEEVHGWPDQFEGLAGRIVFVIPNASAARRTHGNSIKWKSSRGWKALRTVKTAYTLQVRS